MNEEDIIRVGQFLNFLTQTGRDPMWRCGPLGPKEKSTLSVEEYLDYYYDAGSDFDWRAHVEDFNALSDEDRWKYTEEWYKFHRTPRMTLGNLV